jgi:hypothetical protein
MTTYMFMLFGLSQLLSQRDGARLRLLNPEKSIIFCICIFSPVEHVICSAGAFFCNILKINTVLLDIQLDLQEIPHSTVLHYQ